ncbi:MAG: CRISPR-associated endonuclease Cas1 [Gemmatales bacterium]|nr:CRISPR-associated endonuclease Cas1 [Gemmatales bacterium]MDW7994609.1 CRISPR-associated endonuclease Cas1 [Gemmatales bacterium]
MAKRITYIQTPTAYVVGPGKLKVINGRLAFTTGDGAPIRLDLNSLRSIYCYGPVGFTDEAMQMILQHNIDLVWMTPSGNQCYGRVVRYDSSSVALRILQHRVLAYPPARLELAKAIVAAKIESQLKAARHYQRQGVAIAGNFLPQLQAILKAVASAANLDSLRGFEGQASALWYELFSQLLVPPWSFQARQRRPPTDPVNALLSLGYTLLFRRAEVAAEARGLEVAVGALHDFRPGRASLACDLVEPLRVPAVDRWVLTLCNQHRIQPQQFQHTQDGVRLLPDVFPRIIGSWEQHYSCANIGRSLENCLDLCLSIMKSWALRLPEPVHDASLIGASGSDLTP